MVGFYSNSTAGVYTDVSMYKEWIDEIMSSKKLPDYEFSPFPKPSNRISDKEGTNGNSATNSKSMALFVMLSLGLICAMI